MIDFRTLTEPEIDVRVSQCNQHKVSLLLYKTARTDMDILDETVGPENWQNRFYECKGNLYCSLGIHTDQGWIWKDDCGSESNVEAEKGEASDARKRAGFAWGIGRELYTAPIIEVDPALCNIKPKGNGYACYDTFIVERIIVEKKKITALAIKNQTTGRRCFLWQQQR